ncbi:hypothetical protein AGMMS49545_04580 [Betaproteobacteria bacterium]|nr:hypothetical protein AGMMS49545_04580 [Betaproteobacteria bacterium]GHU40999.1 hypothetical protein AGMMS50289_03430 [Betaproteobacteria bacterium]
MLVTATIAANEVGAEGNIGIISTPLGGTGITSVPFTAIADDNYILFNTLTAALDTADVTVTALSSTVSNGNITVATPLTWTSAYGLTFNAGRVVTINDISSNNGALTVTTPGTTTLGAVNLGTGALTVNAAGGITLHSNITAGSVAIANAAMLDTFSDIAINTGTGNQTYNGLTLNTDATLTGGAVTTGNVSGSKDLTVTASGLTTLDTVNLDALTINGTGNAQLNGNITASSVAIANPATLGTHTTLTTGGTVTTGNVSSANHNLNVNASGLTTLGTVNLGTGTLAIPGAGGALLNGNITADAVTIAYAATLGPSTATINTGTGLQNYLSSLALGTNTTLTSGGITAGNITGLNTALTVNVSGSVLPNHLGAVNLGTGALTINAASTVTASVLGNITAGSLTKGGDGTLTLHGTYGEPITVRQGTLALASGSSITSNTLTLYYGATFDTATGSGTDPTLTQLDVRGGTYSGPATYRGNLNVQSGNLNFYLPDGLSDTNTLLDVTGTANISGSDVNIYLDGSSASHETITSGGLNLIVAGGGLTLDSGPIGGVHAATGVAFSYDFALESGGKQLITTVTSTPIAPVIPPLPPIPSVPPDRTTPTTLTWTGATNRNWNILTSENWTPDSTFINGDTVTFTDTGAGAVSIASGGVAPAATIFSNTQGHDYRVSGTISGTGTLTKTGNGNLTLTGNNTYSGNTIINAGSLTLALSGALPNTNVSIASPATFNLYNRVGKNLTLANAARLNVYQGAAITGNLSAIGSQLNFYLPPIATNGYSLLNVGGTANITNSTVNVGILGSSSPLTAGDTVTLINANSLTGNPANTIAHGTGLQGVSLLYDFDLTTNGKQLLATVAGGIPPIDPNPPVTPPIDPNPPVTPPVDPNPPVTPPTNPGINLNPQTKALAEGFLSGTAFLNQAQDFAAERGIHSALQTIQSSDKHGFAAIGYSTLRHNTGSHVDVDGYTLLAGLAATTPTQTGTLTAAAFIEHGEGNYDSYNSFSNAASVHGKGDTQYTGAGILARFAFDETQAAPLYLDASIRSGKVKTDFSGNLYDGFGRAAAYNAKSTYVSAHVGAGYLLKLTEQSKLDVYGQYLWSHQNGDTVKLTTGETVKFEAVDSQRTKLGAKFHHTLTTKTTAYVGAAWEHEYNAKANASIYGYKLDAPKLKGDTGLLEMGLTITPTAANQQGWSLDLGVQGYTGKREGVTGSLRARYRF